jgi:hypothetical protein
MLEDLEFISGSADDLRGRAIIYTVNKTGSDNPFNPRHPALAVAADPSELADILSSIVPFPEEMREMLTHRMRESAELWTRTMFGQKMYQSVQELMNQGLANLDLPDEIREQLEEEMSSIPPDEQTEVPHHGFFVPLVGFDPDVVEPYEGKVDLALSPEVPGISYAGLILTGHAQHYLAVYLLQQDRSAEGLSPVRESAMPNFREMPRDRFLELLKKKVSALMYTQETGGESDQLVRDLMQLTSGTFFVRDALNLVRVAQGDQSEKVKVMELYLRRIELLVAERYEEIPALDERIADLDRGPAA